LARELTESTVFWKDGSRCSTLTGGRIRRPGLHVVRLCRYSGPVTIWTGNHLDFDQHTILNKLRTEGSVAVPGFMQPEGIVVFHTASGGMYKILCEGDELPKGVTTFKEREVHDKLVENKADSKVLLHRVSS
jgi:hypothetical protein